MQHKRPAQQADRLSCEGILSHYRGSLFLSPEVHPLIDSTNLRLRTLAAAGAPEGTVVLAEEQTAGRGRLGRSFYSPQQNGLYMSVLLRPQMPAAAASMITVCAAVAVCEAIEQLTGRQPGIKWVNDLFLDGRKICGILTEASLGVGGALDYAVLGIGVNLRVGELPEELREIVGGINDPDLRRDALAAAILARLEHWYPQLTARGFLPEYRRRSIVLGKPVHILRGREERNGVALAIDDEARLVVRTEDGAEEALGSGEISIRL